MKLSAKPIGEAHVVADDTGSLRLAGGKCAECGAFSFPRAQLCVGCLSEDIAFVPMADSGVLYSYAVIRFSNEHEKMPYAVGYVDLSNGVRVFSHLTDIEHLSVDMPMSLYVTQDGEGDGVALYKFWAAPQKVAHA